MDSNDRAFGGLFPGPNDPDWPGVIQRAAEKLLEAQRRLSAHSDEPDHRRGAFWFGSTGSSFGGGQEVRGLVVTWSPWPTYPPQYISSASACSRTRRYTATSSATSSIMTTSAVSPTMEAVRCSLNTPRSFLMSVGSLHNYFPDVHKYYEETLEALLRSDTSLRRNFVNNAFAAMTFNLGPQVYTRVHLDHLNLAFGLCAITALGNYDYKRGGHLILWDLKLIIEFPPGATILIPSAILRHSNVAIRRGETRYSITQYSAGGLFRWVRCGFQSQKSYLAAGNNLVQEYEEWRGGYKLYSKVSDLRAQA